MKAVNGSRLETHLFGNSVPCPESKVSQFQKRPVFRLSNLRDQFPDVPFQIHQLVNLRIDLPFQIYDFHNAAFHLLQIGRGVPRHIRYQSGSLGRQFPRSLQLHEFAVDARVDHSRLGEILSGRHSFSPFHGISPLWYFSAMARCF